MRTTLPLIPMNTVLFPSIPHSCQIEEKHYYSLIQQCYETREPFGIVLQRSNHPQGTSFYTIGCSVIIHDCTEQHNQTYQLQLYGQQRFQVRYIEQESPYMLAQIEYLPEETVSLTATANANILRSMYLRYWEALATATGFMHIPDNLPEQADTLSYWMADRLQVPVERKQSLLELDLYARLRELNNSIRAELALLPKHVKQRKECLPNAYSLN
jgi:Lon protease-like protein